MNDETHDVDIANFIQDTIHKIIDNKGKIKEYDITRLAKVVSYNSTTMIAVVNLQGDTTNQSFKNCTQTYLKPNDTVLINKIAGSLSNAYIDKNISVTQSNTDLTQLGIGKEYYGSSLPNGGYLWGDGSAISRITYADLFAVIGTTYGVGNGSTTFNLPNRKGKVNVGLDSSQTEFNILGKTGGEKAHTLNVNEIPSHSHTEYLSSSTVNGSTGSESNTHIDGNIIWSTNAVKAITELQTDNTGGGLSHNNLSPYIVCNYIIKAYY